MKSVCKSQNSHIQGISEGADRRVWQWSAMVLIGARWITCKENIMELGQKLKKTVMRVFCDLQTFIA